MNIFHIYMYIHCAKQGCVCTFFTQKKYITVPQLRSARGSHGHQGIHNKSPHHEELQQVQRRKLVTSSCYDTVTSAASVSQHHGSVTECHDIDVNEQQQQQQQQYEVSFGQQEVVIPLDPSDPALKSKKLDYINLPLGKGYVNYTVPAPKSQDQVNQFRVPKPTKASPHSVGMETSGLLPPSNTLKSTSMPELHSYTDENDKIGDDIHHEAAEVVVTGRDEHGDQLKFTPSETPFLECLYCNQGFGYGEIQEYRKHVNSCTESV